MSSKIKYYKDNPVLFNIDDNMKEELLKLIEINKSKSIADYMRGLIQNEINNYLNINSDSEEEEDDSEIEE